MVASEGLKNEKGEPIVPPIFKVGRATYYGDVSAYLANLVIQKLGIKAEARSPVFAEGRPLPGSLLWTGTRQFWPAVRRCAQPWQAAAAS